jgi:hypothetical protein
LIEVNDLLLLAKTEESVDFKKVVLSIINKLIAGNAEETPLFDMHRYED